MNAFRSYLAEWAAIPSTLRQILSNTQKNMTDQQHLDQDVTAISSAFATVISELKAQNATKPDPLDFTKADAFLATIQAEASADAPSSADKVPTPPVTTDTAS